MSEIKVIDEDIAAEIEIGLDKDILETCECHKCGNSIECKYLHNIGEAHLSSLCGLCAQ